MDKDERYKAWRAKLPADGDTAGWQKYLYGILLGVKPQWAGFALQLAVKYYGQEAKYYEALIARHCKLPSWLLTSKQCAN